MRPPNVPLVASLALPEKVCVPRLKPKVKFSTKKTEPTAVRCARTHTHTLNTCMPAAKGSLERSHTHAHTHTPHSHTRTYTTRTLRHRLARSTLDPHTHTPTYTHTLTRPPVAQRCRDGGIARFDQPPRWVPYPRLLFPDRVPLPPLVVEHDARRIAYASVWCVCVFACACEYMCVCVHVNLLCCNFSPLTPPAQALCMSSASPTTAAARASPSPTWRRRTSRGADSLSRPCGAR